MSRPAHQPLGLQHLTRVSRTVSRAFDDALAETGGSLPVWLVLISLKRGQLASQRELAEAVGIEGATVRPLRRRGQPARDAPDPAARQRQRRL
jgi:MarR family transcriptional regulator for hemolysin